jgi:HK97 family phage portal protein
MGLLDIFRRSAPVEERNAENPRVPVSAGDFWEKFGMPGWGVSASGISVNIDNALGVPPVWAAVNFLSGGIASLPMHIYRKRNGGKERVNSRLSVLLNETVNDEMTSFQWRKSLMEAVLTGGRAFTFIERNKAGAVLNLWPLDPVGVVVKRERGRKKYIYTEPGTASVTYSAEEIIDIPFMLKSDGLGHRGPIASNADVIGMAIAATQYGSKFFQNGGVPPFAVTGKFATGGALKRAGDDLAEAVKKAAKDKRQALVLPEGLEIKPLGADPEKTQLIELHRFLVEQIARIYSLPPVFLQDLTHGTFTNTEQQDLQLSKHCYSRWVDQLEQELNLKLFGRNSNVQWVEMSMDGVLRGDFPTRMEGMARAIQVGLLTPNEGRALENRSTDDPAGDRLYMQGAMVPLGSAPAQPAQPAAQPESDVEDDDSAPDDAEDGDDNAA